MPAQPVPLFSGDDSPHLVRGNREWVRDLSAGGERRERACADLYELLLRVARPEAGRRGARSRMVGPEVDDLAHQACADAVLTITRKVSTFRGESKFSTWAYKFVIFEVSAKVNRHFWANGKVSATEQDWEQLPERFGLDPQLETEQRDLVAAVQQAVADTLTVRQRRVFVALVLNQMPIDELANDLGCNRNAVYKVMFDARKKLRSTLQARGYLAATNSPYAVPC